MTLAPFFWPAGEGEGPRFEPPPGVVVLGHDEMTHLVVRPGGDVVSIHPGGMRFVNSSEPLFRESLEALRAAWDARRSLSDAEADAQARRLRAELTAIDPPAVTGIDHWWALVLEQLDDGLL